MKYLSLTLLFVSLTGAITGCTPKQQTPAEQYPLIENFNRGWQFHRFDNTKKHHGIADIAQLAWENVTLPHTAKIEPKIVNNQWQGDAFYRKAFNLPGEWQGKKVYLRFEGAMNKVDVWLNGEHVLTHQGGYLPFIVDLSDAGKFGAVNSLIVKLDNRDNPITGPKPLEILDFNMYGGIYRDAFLIVRDSLHITDEIQANKPAGGGIFVSYPEVNANKAQVRVKTHIQNAGDTAQTFSITQTLFFNGKKIASDTSGKTALDAGKDIETTQTITVKNPALWSPRKPNLHTLVTEVHANGQPVDKREIRIGIRHIDIRQDGFFINGEKMFLRGVNRHQEYPYVGYALSNNANYRDAYRIKSAGLDYVRLSHYPHSKAFMDAADELGIVLLDAILGWQYFNPDKAFQEHVLQTCRDMIRRDRNHASVIAWECSLNESDMPKPFIDKLHKIVHEEYPGNQVWSAGWTAHGYDIYLQARQHRIEHYEEPTKPYFVSEYGDWEYFALNAGLNQDAWENLLPEHRTSRQLLSDGEKRLLQQATNVQEAHNDNFNVPAIADSYWVMFDYNRGYADDLEASGIMSIDRLPKYSYYFFQSQRNPGEKSDRYASGPMVFIASEWTETSSTDVRIFSNCNEVELFLNGDNKGRQAPDSNSISGNLAHPPFTFSLDEFAPGKLEAVCFIGGKPLASHAVITPEAPVKLELAVDTSGKNPEAGVNDLVFVYARIVDKNGTTVSLNDEVIDFQIGGDAELINPDTILTEAGIASALLRIGDSLEGITITAKSEKLSLQGDALRLDIP